MSQQHEARPRERSAFAAGFLSLIFPGLGHAYAGAWRRAIAFGAVPLVLVALLAGTVLAFGPIQVIAWVANGTMLTLILVGNILAYLYRIVAAVDAWRVVSFTNRYERRAPRGPVAPWFASLSVAGLAAVCLVMGGSHAAVAFYDARALELYNGIYAQDDRSFPSPNASAAEPDETEFIYTPSPGASLATPDPAETEAPDQQVTWDGTQRLNLLIIGSDKRPKDGTWNTDTLMVLSVDPASRQVAMFTLPRDITGIPLPPGPMRNTFGSVWPYKVNQVFMRSRSAYPGGGYQALKATLGYLYGIKIHYFVEVDFNGFERVIDALGGVTINVQAPVVDDNYPGKKGRIRVYIPTGVRHMTGEEALVYARSRHGSSDFDRGSRQQRVVLSLRQQADFSTLARPEVLDKLVKAAKNAVKTDFPLDKLPAAVELAQRIDIKDVRTFVFGPVGGYAVDHWPESSAVTPIVANIRRAVRDAFKFKTTDDEERARLAKEAATVWVLQGGGTASVSDIAAYLQFRGLSASAPRVKAPVAGSQVTVIRVYNAKDGQYESTIAVLEKVFDVKAVAVDDPKVKADILVITGPRTPDLKEPTIGN